MLNPQTADAVVNHALSLGADFVELFIEKNQVNNIATLSTDVQSVQSGIDFGIGIRVVYGTKVLYGYTNKTDPDELSRIVGELAAKDLRDPATTSTAFDFVAPNDIHAARDT